LRRKNLKIHAEKSRRLLALICAVLCPVLSGQAAEMRTLPGHVPEAVARLQPLGRVPATNRLRLAISLPLRNQDALSLLLQRLYDPASPDYHHFLTPEQFTEEFGPTQEDYQKVIQFAQASGLEVTTTRSSRLLLDVQGKAGDVEKAFHVTLRNYQHPTELRQFYAADVEPTVDAGLPILDVSGLGNFARMRPALRRKSERPDAVPAAGTGPGGNFMGKDFANAYLPGVSLTGAGQMIGLLEFDTYYSNDIANYEALAGLPNVPLINVPLDGFSGPPGSDVAEVSLDIEMAVSMAPGLTAAVIFEAPNASGTAGWIDILDSMASSNQIKQFSSAWGYTFAEGPDPNTNFDTEFQKMAAQGQSFFQASGDGDAWVNPVWVPADSPYVTSVGGTFLTMNGSGASYGSETVWNSGNLGAGEAWPNNGSGYWGSGGGVSTVYAIPTWQQSVSMAANSGSTNMRNIPDVALTADDVWVIYNNGESNSFMGTSCAAPLWAGFIALVNQQATANGDTNAGFINPAIYALGRGTNYASCFHDITSGNNTNAQSDNLYAAVSGYDLCTGWGTPSGSNLINALAPPNPLAPPSFTALPTNQTLLSGTTATFTAATTGGLPQTFRWRQNETNLTNGANVSGSTSTALTLSNVSLAGAGSYTIVVSNAAGAATSDPPAILTVYPSPQLVQNGEFETDSFADWTLSGNASGNLFVSTGSAYAYDSEYGVKAGPGGSPGYLSQTLLTVPGQLYLISFWFDSDGYEAYPNEFSVAWNGSTLFDQTDIPDTGWTNMQFTVAATLTNTVLRFGFRNDPAYFGLDDVSVLSLRPMLQNAAHVGGTITFSWIALQGSTYQIQSATNLTQINWTNLGSPISAGNFLATATNAIGTNHQQFYRILLQP
jgi:subtilase family serine protease